MKHIWKRFAKQRAAVAGKGCFSGWQWGGGCLWWRRKKYETNRSSSSGHGGGGDVENERPRIARMKRIFLSPKAIKKHRKPLEGKGDSVESSCHQRPACLRASSQQSNADTMNPTGRGPKNLVTTRAQELLFLADRADLADRRSRFFRFEEPGFFFTKV